jgi:hypothetical protein
MRGLDPRIFFLVAARRMSMMRGPRNGCIPVDVRCTADAFCVEKAMLLLTPPMVFGVQPRHVAVVALRMLVQSIAVRPPQIFKVAREIGLTVRVVARAIHL